jgi:hypothetical protein
VQVEGEAHAEGVHRAGAGEQQGVGRGMAAQGEAEQASGEGIRHANVHTGYRYALMDLGPPISYLVLEVGTAVYGPGEEELGRVQEIFADEEKDIFDGLLMDGPRGLRYAAADQIAELHERGVMLNVGAEGLSQPRNRA